MASQLQLAWLQTMVVPAQIAQHKWGVPASVTLAQAILESAWGQSQLARRCNNFFGIKALPGEAYEEFTTREVVTGRSVDELARFAKYPSAVESFDAHGHLLATLPRYAAAMKLRHAPYAFGLALGGSGYSTEPDYGHRLGELIEHFYLEQYDTPPQPDEPAAQEAA